jgi:hypothetical protein
MHAKMVLPTLPTRQVAEHKPTIQAMWVSAAVVALLLVAVIFLFVT